MKILYLAHRIPFPPDKGDKIRSFNQIRHLSNRHEIDLVCLVDAPEDVGHLETLKEYCKSVDHAYRGKYLSMLLAGSAVVTGAPLSVGAFYSRKLQELVNRNLKTRNYDLIYVYSSAMAAYVQHVSGVPRIMDFVDVDSEKWKEMAMRCGFPSSWLYRMEAARLARHERRVAEKFDCSLFVSEEEARLFNKQLQVENTFAIPNGVDVDYFSPPRDTSRSGKSATLVFTGMMDYFPNVDGVTYFCKEILGRIRKSLPAVKFYIVGRNPSRNVEELNQDPSVVVTGSVPDIRPYLAMADVAVAPLRIARGIQNKILEAMAAGLPVVGTAAAFEGIEAQASDGVRIVDAPEAFAGEVLTLLQNGALRRQCSLDARRYVTRHHRWHDHGVKLEALLQQISQGRPVAARM